MEKQAVTAGALFCGIGGFCEGLRRAGIETRWANDFDEQVCRTYRNNYPHTRLIEKDVRRLSVIDDELEPVDILTAGFPCQSFSQAGQRKGFDDERGKLFFEIVRLLGEFGEQRPKVLVLENAPHLKYGDGGNWFLRISDEIKKSGYWFRDSNALELELSELTGIPQTRTRLFLIAFSTSFFRSGRFEMQSELGAELAPLSQFIDFQNTQDQQYYLPEENRYYKMISSQKEVQKDDGIYQLRKYFVRAKNKGLCPTLTANMGAGGHNVPFVWDKGGLRKLTEYECLQLQGFPLRDKFEFPPDLVVSRRYQQIGNAVPPPLVSIIAKTIQKKIEKENC